MRRPSLRSEKAAPASIGLQVLCRRIVEAVIDLAGIDQVNVLAATDIDAVLTLSWSPKPADGRSNHSAGARSTRCATRPKKTKGSGRSVIRRHSRKASARIPCRNPLDRSLCRNASAHNLDRNPFAHSLDHNAFARSRDLQDVRGNCRPVQKRRGNDR